MEKFSTQTQQTTTEGSSCVPCKAAAARKLSVLVSVDQFRNNTKEWSTTAISQIQTILKETTNFTDLQINTLIKSLQVTPSSEQLLYAGPEAVAAEIYNRLLNSGIMPKISGGINKF